MSTAALFLSKNIASICKIALTCFPRLPPLLCSYSGALATSTVQPRHSQNRTDVLTAAFAAVLLIFGRFGYVRNNSAAPFEKTY